MCEPLRVGPRFARSQRDWRWNPRVTRKFILIKGHIKRGYRTFLGIIVGGYGTSQGTFF